MILDKEHTFESEFGERIGLECPYCGTYAHMSTQSVPNPASLLRDKPKHVGLVYQCDACNAPVFLRFAGCNLWSGREQHRATAVCRFCDTEFVGIGGQGGGKFDTAAAMAAAVAGCWPEAAGDRRYVVCTGGEPLLQLDAGLVAALHRAVRRWAT